MSRVWYRGLASEIALEGTRLIEDETRSVRNAIETELARRRWP